MSASVSLSHHGGALKVDEGPGNAGMGWSVNTGGGYVSREVRGLPDDYNGSGSDTRKGWLFNSNAQNIQGFTIAGDDNLGLCNDEVSDWSFINNLGYVRDCEPDIYYFEAPGISGKFIFGTDGLPKLIPYQDLQITVGGPSGGFTIKTNTGLVYVLNVGEAVTRQAGQYKSTPIGYLKSDYNYFKIPISYTTTWNLASITSTATGVSAVYTYSAGEQALSTQYYSGIRGTSTQVDTLFFVRDLYSPMNLTRIDLKNYNIVFTWGNDLIDKITFTESETGDTKEYDLIYKDIGSSTYTLRNKPFLMAVKQVNSCVAFPDYKFTYFAVDTTARTIPIPWKTGWGQDHFGYYNGRNGNKNIPTVYYYAGESGARRFRVTPIPLTTETQKLSGLAGENMDVNATYSVYGALTRLDYPTGGTTTITYEANKFLDGTTNQELLGPGLRVASIRTSGGDAAYGKSPNVSITHHELKKTYQYVATDGTTTSGRILYPPVLGFTDGINYYRTQKNLSPGTEVLYNRVKELITGQGSRVYLYDLVNSYPDATSDATVSKIARTTGTCTLLSLAKNGPYTFPFAPVTDTGFKRGFLRRVSEYSEAGTLTTEKRMVYTMPQTIASIKGLRFEAIHDGTTEIFYYSTYVIPVNQSRILSAEYVTSVGDESAADSTRTNILYKYNAKNMLTRTTQTNDDNSVVQNNIKYAMSYSITTPTPGDIQAEAIKKLNSDNRYGEIIESYQKVLPSVPVIPNDTIVAGAQLNIFKVYGSYVWPYQQKHLPPGAALTVSTQTGTTTQSFVSDADYILDATVDYANGLPVNQIGTSMIQTGTHYSTNTGLPVVSFVNCKAENAIYEGFELATGKGLTASNGTQPSSIVEARTGQKSMILNGFLLNSASVTKSENSYRVSVWAYSTAASTITIKAKDGVTTQQIALTYPSASANKWEYLEGFINTTTLASSFTFEISSSASIRLDDFVGVPRSAFISFSTVRPLTGITSQTDNRGNSTVIVYDAMGRKMNVLDKNRNLVELTEYGFQKQGKVTLNANFTSNVTSYFKGQTVVFTAGPTCVSGVTYQWTFTDYLGNVTTATGAVVNKIFSRFGGHTAKLTASKAGYITQSFSDYICINPDLLTVDVTVSPTNTVHQCSLEGEWVKTFSANISWTSNPGLTVTYSWEATDLQGNWISVAQGSPNVISATGSQMVYNSQPFSYQVRCVVTVRVEGIYGLENTCQVMEASATDFSAVTYINDQPCP